MDCKRLLREALTGRVAVVGLLALCGTAAPVSWAPLEDGVWAPKLSVALADQGRGRGGDDGGGSSGSGRDGGDDSSGSDDSGSGSGSGSDDSGSGGGSGSDDSGSGGGDDSSGRGRGRGGDDDGSVGSDDSSGSGRSGDDSSSNSSDDSVGDGSGRAGDDSGRGRGGGRDRPEAVVDLSDREVEAVLRGERVLVDDRGRVLEVEIEIEHGVRTVIVKPHGGDFARNPGPIGNVRAVNALPGSTSPAPVDRRREGLEVEIEHGVVVTKPHGGSRSRAAPAPAQVGGDLTPAEEAVLIQGGWR